jgi:hypothetical protein
MWFNFWKWPKELIEDYNQWSVVREALKEEDTKQKFSSFKYEMRTDRIGRIYTVINVPDELIPYEFQNQVWPWVLDQLREIDELLLSCRLNDIVYPEVTRIEEYPAYLVVLTPSIESLDWSKFFGWIFNTIFTFSFLFLSNKIVTKITNKSVIDYIISLFN